MNRRVNILLCLTLLAASACHTSQSSLGGVEAGNPPAPATRQVRGSVAQAPSGSAYLTAEASFSCLADTVIATDAQDQEFSAAIQTDCSFSISLEVDKAYAFDFELGGSPVGSLVFQTDPAAFPSSYFVVSQGETDIDLGAVTFDSYTAVPEQEPSVQNDQDGDGVVDYDDDDDNGDETVDVEQADCDLDGLWDVYDEDVSACSADDDSNETGGSDVAQVLEVLPRSGAGITKFKTAVGLDTDIEVRFSCQVDPETVTASTFQIRDVLGNDVDCEYELSANGKVVACDYGDDLLSMLTVYTAAIDGVACLGGSAGDAVSWSWMTVGLW